MYCKPQSHHKQANMRCSLFSRKKSPPPSNPPPKPHYCTTCTSRPTNYISSAIPFYVNGLGYQQVGYEENVKVQQSTICHHGALPCQVESKRVKVNRIMLVHPRFASRLELTEQQGHEVGTLPRTEPWVFPFLDEKKWEETVQRMEQWGCKTVEYEVPQWKNGGKGRTFEDADGYKVMLWLKTG